MKKVLLFAFSILLNFLIYGSPLDTIRANNPLIEYTGRIDFSKPMSPNFSYSGVSVRACFRGTSISVILNDAGTQNFYNVILDHIVSSRLQTRSGINVYKIKGGLKDTLHEIELFRLTEEMFGKTQFLGFILDKGKSLIAISNKRGHLIEFIGNSITCGYGNEGKNGEKFGPTTENHYLTYAAITSRSFNARHLAVCKSGIGIYRNWDGPVNGNPDCMPHYYERIFLYEPAPLYNFAQKPDLICIDLGTNDFSTNKGDSSKYVNGYLKFLETVQLKNKAADIICLLGPMLEGNDLNRIRRYLHIIVDAANKKKNGKVYFFEMSEQTGSLDYGIDSHPTIAQHLKNAKELVEYIHSLKGWKVYADALN